jgi:hypothetical protein
MKSVADTPIFGCSKIHYSGIAVDTCGEGSGRLGKLK